MAVIISWMPVGNIWATNASHLAYRILMNSENVHI